MIRKEYGSVCDDMMKENTIIFFKNPIGCDSFQGRFRLTWMIAFFLWFSFTTVSTPMDAEAKNLAKNPLDAAVKHMQSGDYAKAIPLLKGYQRTNPGNAESFFRLGECYLKIEKHSRAHQAFQKTMDLDEKYGPRIAKRYVQTGLHALRQGNMRKSRILFQKATIHDASSTRKIARKVYEEGKRVFRQGEYEAADERFSIASSFDHSYNEKICDMYYHLGNSLDSNSCLYFYAVAHWYCPDHNETIGMRLLQIAQSHSDEKSREKYKTEAAKYIGTEAVESTLPEPAKWRVVHTENYKGRGYDEKNSPEYHIRTIQWGKEARNEDQVLVESDSLFRLWDSGWQEWDSRCVFPPGLRTSGQYLYLEGEKDAIITVQVQRFQ